MESNNELIELMREMVRLQRILVKPVFKALAEEVLDKPEKKIVFELTDGINTREQIIESSHVAAGTISEWWMNWFSKGLLEKDGKKYRKIISLGDVGISVPAIKTSQIKQAAPANDTIQGEVQ
jgi:hypothetical protein